ncbi:hypothetical protein BJV78DRAFT_386380 [Lactifluus subvellereus]|nr:hypothetical protein BJV78DRAFT_386380 [Lactifluus subvellereus]
MPHLHVPHTMERVKEADTILENAKLRVEKYGNAIGPDNYHMARGLLTFTGDFRIGLDDNSMFGHPHKAQVYLDKARETEKNIKIITMREQVKEADTILENARLLVEERRNVIGLDDYNIAMGWLALARYFRTGLDDDNIFGHLDKAQVYVDKAWETEKNIKLLTRPRVLLF